MKRYLLIILFFSSSLFGMMKHPAQVAAYFLPGFQNIIRQQLINLLQTATKNISVAMFTFTDWEIAQQLAQLAMRGINVEVIVDSETIWYNRGQSNPDGQQVVMLLLGAGIPVFFGRTDPDGLMHNKYVIIDHQKVWTGSPNFTRRAFDQQPPYNDENIIIIESLQIAQLFQGAFDQLKNRLPRVVAEDLSISPSQSSENSPSSQSSMTSSSESESDVDLPADSRKRRRMTEPKLRGSSQAQQSELAGYGIDATNMSYDEAYEIIGKIRSGDLVQSAIDEDSSSEEAEDSSTEEEEESATSAQLNYIRRLGGKAPGNLTKSQASALINRLKKRK